MVLNSNIQMLLKCGGREDNKSNLMTFNESIKAMWHIEILIIYLPSWFIRLDRKKGKEKVIESNKKVSLVFRCVSVTNVCLNKHYSFIARFLISFRKHHLSSPRLFFIFVAIVMPVSFSLFGFQQLTLTNSIRNYI